MRMGGGGGEGEVAEEREREEEGEGDAACGPGESLLPLLPIGEWRRRRRRCLR